jgi:hypothetical protein
MTRTTRLDLARDLVLPTLLFAALGGMSWAVRGCSGFGTVGGCIFAGVLWGAGWWYIAHDPKREQSRRYSSAWIVLAVTLGVGLAGERGWMQWPSFFEGRLMTNYGKEEFVPIPRAYGFLWLFLAGVPWAGLGACALAWCGSLRETRIWHWVFRIACGLGGGWLAHHVYTSHPEYFLPLYRSIESKYHDLAANPSLKKLVRDNGEAMTFLGYYLGFLFYEIVRRDWKNSLLIVTVGIVNGCGWAACQNWSWARHVFPNASFNFWRCWESSGGISMGIAYGLAYFLVNRPMSEKQQAIVAARRAISGPNLDWLLVASGLNWLVWWFLRYRLAGWDLIYFGTVNLCFVLYYALYRSSEDTPAEDAAVAASYGDPNLERLGLWLGILCGLGLSIRNGLKGWFNIYKGNERYWDQVLWQDLGPVFLLCLIAIAAWVLLRPLPRNFRGDVFPRAYGVIWLVLIVQNAIAQLITGPPSEWREMAFSIYYLLLFAITGVIVAHYHFVKRVQSATASAGC